MENLIRSLLAIPSVSAQGETSEPALGYTSQLLDALSEFINYSQGIVSIVAGAVIVIVIMIGGIQYINGNPEAGKKTLLAAIIGVVIILLATTVIATLNYLSEGTRP